jgi:hypothetical protein
MSVRDIGAVELNETFAAQVISVRRVSGIDIQNQRNIHASRLPSGTRSEWPGYTCCRRCSMCSQRNTNWV